MAYALLASPAAQRELDGLPRRIGDGIRAVLMALAQDPRSERFDLRLLRGRNPGRRLRLRIGDYRVLLSVDHARREILVARIGHRSSVYKAWDADP